MHKYTDEEESLLRKIAPGHTGSEITKMFNKHFSLSLTELQIKSFRSRKFINNGLDAKFKKGSIPVNKGTKGFMKPNRTSFKKGNRPKNWVPVGSERIDTDGYVDIKIAEPHKWKQKHHILWEQQNGPIPEGYVLVFKDSNKQNVSLENIAVISRSELLIMNKNMLIFENPKLTESGLLVARIMDKTNKKRKKKNHEE